MTSVLVCPIRRTRIAGPGHLGICLRNFFVCLQLAQYCLSETKNHGEISFPPSFLHKI